MLSDLLLLVHRKGSVARSSDLGAEGLRHVLPADAVARAVLHGAADRADRVPDLGRLLSATQLHIVSLIGVRDTFLNYLRAHAATRLPERAKGFGLRSSGTRQERRLLPLLHQARVHVARHHEVGLGLAVEGTSCAPAAVHHPQVLRLLRLLRRERLRSELI